MNCFEKYLVALLQGHLSYEGVNVEVRKEFSHKVDYPLVTLDLSGGVTTNYAYHDTDGAEDVLYFHRTSNINVNVYCNTESERESICNQILECFYLEKTCHYRYCTRYSDGQCGNTGACKVSTIDNCFSQKNMCPSPDTYGYSNIREKYHIVEGTINIEPPFDLDEYDKHPPLLHSVLRASADYFEPVLEEGEAVDDIVMGEVVIVDGVNIGD